MNVSSVLTLYFHEYMLNQAYITVLEKQFLRPVIATQSGRPYYHLSLASKCWH